MSKSTKTTQESKPPAWSQPLFTKSAEDALNLYNSGSGGNTYMGSTVAPLSGTTMQGVNQLRNAGANWDTSGTRGLYQGIGATANNLYSPIATGATGITTSDEYKDVYNRAGAKSAADTYLTDMASGKWLKEGNPYFNARLESQLEDTAAQTRSLASGSGRYGSDVSNRMLTERIGNLRTDALAQDWDRNLMAQLAATGQIDAARSQGIGNQLSSLAGLTGAESANIQNRLAAAGGLVNASMGAANAMSGLDQRNFENRLAGAGATLQAGNILDTQGQRLLADEIAKFYSLDNEGWNKIGLLQNAAAGSAGPYGTQIATSRQPMDIGGLLGGFGKLLGKSDIRAKENILLVGEANGIPLYEFSYRGEHTRWVGTMAQAIPLHRAGALYIDPADGLYGVDYSRLGFAMMRVH